MQTDLATRVAAQMADELNGDEVVRAAVRVNAVGERALGDWLDSVDPPRELPNWSTGRDGSARPTATRTKTPIGYLLAVSDDRLLAFRRAFNGKAKGLVAAWDAEGMTIDYVDRGQRARTRRFVVGLGDGTVVAADMAINGELLEQAADAFVAAIERR